VEVPAKRGLGQLRFVVALLRLCSTGGKSPIEASVGRITRRKPTFRYQCAFKSEGLIALLLRPIFEGDDQVELGVPWQM
jgi:hypothetical protein